MRQNSLMDERDQVYDRMDSQRLYGRGGLLDKLVSELDAGCTLFGLDGVGGIGKSQVADRFAWAIERDKGYDIVRVDASDHQTQELLVAGLYEQLKDIPRTGSQQLEGLATRFLERSIGGVKRLAAAAFRDVMKQLNEKLEHTTEAIAKELTGEASEVGVGAMLASASEANQRLFVRNYMTFVAELGHPVVIVVDNYEDTEPSAQALLQYLLQAKPDHWVLVLAANLEKISETDWTARMAPQIAYHSGVVMTVGAPAIDAIADWFRDEMHREPTQAELEKALAYTGNGRPAYLGPYFAALRGGRELPRSPNLKRLHEIRRAQFDIDARRLAEAMAVARPDALIPLRLVESVGRHLGLSHVGSAIDALKAGNQIVAIGENLKFYHSSYRDGWHEGTSEPELQQLRHAWYAVYRESQVDVAALSRARLLPALAEEIVANDDEARVTQLAESLIGSGNVNDALVLVDASWQSGGSMERRGADVIDHALIAAQTRLELGRYREAHEALRAVQNRGGESQGQLVTADLIRLKLALRQNSYQTVWRIADKLANEASDDMSVQLERELVVNTALRDLHDRPRISESVERLRRILATVAPSLRAKAERSLARSLAKLGEADESLSAAKAALAAAEEGGDVRSIGNAKLAMAEALRYAGRLEEAIAAYCEGEDLARGSGNRDSEIWCILGRACAFLEKGDIGSARLASRSASRLVLEPGFEHPLEQAHVELLDLLASLLESREVDRASVIARYQQLGIEWPADFISLVAAERRLSGPIPI